MKFPWTKQKPAEPKKLPAYLIKHQAAQDAGHFSPQYKHETTNTDKTKGLQK